jgi:dTDP-4-amino-4,6-dideoxygalactose transaminase
MAFDVAFAEPHVTSFAVACTRATTGLHLALIALGVGPGDEVIVPSFTWVATANAVLYCGATPVVVDVEPWTYNIDPIEVEAKITAKTRAIIPVHLFGLCANMDAIAAVAGGIPLVEDAACAAGARYKGRSAGALGAMGVFSFHPRKIITTGEGGMVTTNDGALAEKMACLRNHGGTVPEAVLRDGPRPYLMGDYETMGFNYRMTDLQAAVGRVQLGRMDGIVAERQRWARFYSDALGEIPWLHTPVVPTDGECAWQSYVCRVDEQLAPMPRNAIMDALAEAGIATRPGTHAVHMLGLFRDRGMKPEDCPNARDCDRLTMAIPMHNQMSEEDFAYVVETLLALG